MEPSSSASPTSSGTVSREQQFNELIKKAYSLNNKCLDLSKNLTDLIGDHQADGYNGDESRDVELTSVKSLSFKPLSSDEQQKIFVMRVEGEKKKVSLKSLRSCFLLSSDHFISQSSVSKLSSGRAEWRNLLRTPVPEISFFDLNREIEIYELLNPQKEKGLEEVRLFVQGLERVEQELLERVEQVKREIGLGERVMRIFNEKLRQTKSTSPPTSTLSTRTTSATTSPTTTTTTTTTTPTTATTAMTSTTTPIGQDQNQVQVRELYFIVKETDLYLRSLKIEFNLVFSHERAIKDLENFEMLIDQYYEIAQNQDELIERERKGREERDQHDKEQREQKERGEKERKEREDKKRDRRFPESSLIQTPDDKDLLLGWLEEARGKENVRKTTLLYRASKDGFGAADFHSRCDSQGPTVVVFRTSEGRRGGGYSNVSWESRNQWNEDGEGKSFLFSLDHRSKHNYKGNTGKAIYENGAHGPTFGGGYDLIISSNCNNNIKSYSNPSSYFLPNNYHLAGSRFFQVVHYEVWKIE